MKVHVFNVVKSSSIYSKENIYVNCSNNIKIILEAILNLNTEYFPFRNYSLWINKQKVENIFKFLRNTHLLCPRSEQYFVGAYMRNDPEDIACYHN